MIASPIVNAGVILDLEEPDPHDPALVLRVGGRLFVETAAGERLVAEDGTVGIAFGRGRSRDPVERASYSAIAESIDRMLGRGSAQVSTPSAWEQLTSVLTRVGAELTQEELRALPFVYEFSERLDDELGRLA